jgi:hypothetical protein
MKNAHERFGYAEFGKKLKDTTTLIRLNVDCFIGECLEEASGQGHLLSAIGTDVEVAALWAAIVNGESIHVAGPNLKRRTFNFGEKPRLHRGTLRIAGKKRPVRHLVAVSAALDNQADSGRIILKDGSAELILRGVANLHGLPLLPVWSGWLHQRLQRARRIQPLIGLNCDPVAITGTKQELLAWIGAGVKRREIQIPPV